ncbi:hypothetical protein Hanom_Chr01g00032111 [Helianthus anomalus]
MIFGPSFAINVMFVGWFTFMWNRKLAHLETSTSLHHLFLWQAYHMILSQFPLSNLSKNHELFHPFTPGKSFNLSSFQFPQFYMMFSLKPTLILA